MESVEDYQAIIELQKRELTGQMREPEYHTLHASWLREDTVDFWRHRRMYETVAPLADFYRNKQWLSIGDGRYGLDARRLNRMFGIDVFPTDISADCLERGKTLGLIERFGVENAEQLSFPDNAFDIVFCKESFHHFPRPILALYEMIRVSRIAVILIEPNDRCSLNHPRVVFRYMAKMLFNAAFPRKNIGEGRYSFFADLPGSYEESGNYVYSLSAREIEKIVRGANFGGFAWKGLNDYYIKGCEFEPAIHGNPMFESIRGRIRKLDERCRKMPLFCDWSIKTGVVFKKNVDPTLKAKMVSAGYTFSKAVENPYLHHETE